MLKWLDFISWRLYSSFAKKRRKRGAYDHVTLGCFRRAYKKKPDRDNLLNYLRFRRDLGYRSSARYLKKLASYPQGNLQTARRFILNANSELPQKKIPDGFSSSELLALSERSPSAAIELEQRGVKISSFSWEIARMHRKQKNWNSSFSSFLRQHKGSICVVGNSSNIEGSKQGKVIDSHSIVLRFNQFSKSIYLNTPVGEEFPESSMVDTGNQLDVWSMAPDLESPFPLLGDQSVWVVLSGPDMRFQLADWSNVVQILKTGNKVVTVPLRIWRNLVKELKAPPSAGVLCLAWVIDIIGSPKGISVTGFQRTIQPGVRYHYSLLDQKPGSRHNWAKERKLLLRWETKGLNFLS